MNMHEVKIAQVVDSNFFLDGNKQVGFWDIDELKLLCKSLRFPDDLVLKYSQQSITGERISTQKLKNLISQSSFFKICDGTFNNHSADFNVPALLQSIDVIEARLATFGELHSMYLAYTTYELANMTGILAKVDVLLDTFKLCGKIISPAKLEHRLKHARVNHARENTVQFHEFLQLMLWCDSDNYPVFPELSPPKERNSLGLYKVDHPNEYLTTASERIHANLDKKYFQDELSYASKKVPVGVSGHRVRDTEDLDVITSALQLDAGISRNQLSEGKLTGKIVKNQVMLSNQEVREVKADCRGPGIFTKELLEREISSVSPMQSPDFGQMDNANAAVNLSDLKAKEMYEILRAYMQERERRLKGVVYDEKETLVKPYIAKKEPLMEPIVSSKDIAETRETIKQMEIEQRFMQRRMLLLRQHDTDDDKEEVQPKRTVGEIASHLHNPPPLRFSAHEKNCDFRKRGMHHLKEPGTHLLITEANYDENSPNGKNLANLHSTLVGHGNWRAKGIRIVNPEKVLVPQDDPTSDFMNARDIFARNRAESEDINKHAYWMAAFSAKGSRQAGNGADFEQYYIQKMTEFGVSVPDNLVESK